MATTTSVHSHGVMEGNGAYNRHARIPAGGAALALPLLEEAVRSLDLRGRDEPVVVADYGSSQGKNSLTPMRAAIRGLRTRIGPDRPIFVTHVDQPANDFNTLFDVLHSDPECYSADDPNVFPSAIGRSFYESVFPKEHVHLGWSSYAAVWLSRIPMPIAGHFVSVGSKGAVRTAFERQGADDWKLFLSLRATELRPGGRLVVVLPALNDEGTAGLEPLFERANESLAALVAEGAISNEDRMRMVLGAHPRRRSELLAPFRADGRFCGLTVECCELSTVPDAAWADYQRKGDEDALSTRRAQFFRSVFVPSLASAICDEAKRTAFPDRLEEKLKRRLAERPVPLDSFVQTIVLARESSNSIHRT
jgi:SAM dependent carboxyl methyltransferase